MIIPMLTNKTTSISNNNNPITLINNNNNPITLINNNNNNQNTSISNNNNNPILFMKLSSWRNRCRNSSHSFSARSRRLRHKPRVQSSIGTGLRVNLRNSRSKSTGSISRKSRTIRTWWWLSWRTTPSGRSRSFLHT